MPFSRRLPDTGLVKEQARILIIDGDADTRRTLHGAMLGAGFHVSDTEHPREAIALGQVLEFDIILLNLTLQDCEAGTCQALRAGIPRGALVVLTASNDPNTIVQILDAGADQCLPRPSHWPEFLARLRATLRPSWNPLDSSNDKITIGDITLEPSRRQVYRAGVLLQLTPKEFDLLHHLMMHAGLPITHSSLLKAGWGPNELGRVEYLRIFMRQLRTKLHDQADPQYILTDNCIGYRFAEPERFLLPANPGARESAAAAF
jgi:two-component system KDP operon response regulator KdpE